MTLTPLSWLLGCALFQHPPPVDSAPPQDTQSSLRDSRAPQDTQHPESIMLAGPTVLLVSIDGFAQDYWEQAQMPTLKAMAEGGARAEALQPVYPSKTFPNHYSQATGLYPEHHGIIDNSFVDPVSGASFDMSTNDPMFWLGEPIWITAERQDVTTATLFWPGSEVSFDGDRPSYWVPYNGSLSHRSRVEQIIEWVELPAAERPQFMTLYFSDVDHAGHSYGPTSGQVYGALEQVDAALAMLVQDLQARGVYEQMDIVVVSDHGMDAFSRERVELLDTHIDMTRVLVRSWAQHQTMDLVDPSEQEEIMAGLAELEHARCYTKAEMPEYLHFSESERIPAITCLPEPGWVLSTTSYFQGSDVYSSGGTHGWDPTYQAMQGIFVAHGPHFKQGHVHPTFDQVQIYNLLAQVLEIQPADNDGELGQVQGLLRE